MRCAAHTAEHQQTIRAASAGARENDTAGMTRDRHTVPPPCVITRPFARFFCAACQRGVRSYVFAAAPAFAAATPVDAFSSFLSPLFPMRRRRRFPFPILLSLFTRT